MRRLLYDVSPWAGRLGPAQGQPSSLSSGGRPALRAAAWIGSVVLGLGLLGCQPGGVTATSPATESPPVIASPRPVAPTPTVTVSETATPAPVATQTPAVLSSPSATSRLETTTILYSGALSVEDLNTLMLDLRAMAGVSDVQGGAGDLTISYDPAQTTRQQLIDIIKNHGYTVKED